MTDRQPNVERALLRQLQAGDSPLVARVRRHNQILLHNFTQPVKKKFVCALRGCDREFEVEIVPDQALYPKFCEEHRTEHRRGHHRKCSPK